MFNDRDVGLFRGKGGAHAFTVVASVRGTIFRVAFVAGNANGLRVKRTLRFHFLRRFSQRINGLFIVISPAIRFFKDLRGVRRFLGRPLIGLYRFVCLVGYMSNARYFQCCGGAFVNQLAGYFIGVESGRFFIFRGSIRSLSCRAGAFLSRFFGDAASDRCFAS